MGKAAQIDAKIAFDVKPAGTALLFGPRGCFSGRWGSALWWTGAVSPEVIDEVVTQAGRGRLCLDAIVIAGLGRYPVSDGEWPRWLVRWARQAGAPRVVVHTGGLTAARRRRLIRRVRRQTALQPRTNPVVRVIEAIERWFVGRGS